MQAPSPWQGSDPWRDPMLVRLYSKSSRLGFIIMWAENFQIFQFGFEKAEDPEIKLPTFAGPEKSKAIPEKNMYLCFIDYTVPLCG